MSRLSHPSTRFARLGRVPQLAFPRSGSALDAFCSRGTHAPAYRCARIDRCHRGKQNNTDDSIRRHMTTLETSLPEAHRGAAAAWLPALLLLFIGSGCAALIYEVVWFQLLQLSIGSSAVSLGVLLGIYMGGMCHGSLLLPRYVPTDRHPLRVYAYLELGIGAFGVVVLYAVPFLGGLYTESVSYTHLRAH